MKLKKEGCPQDQIKSAILLLEPIIRNKINGANNNTGNIFALIVFATSQIQNTYADDLRIASGRPKAAPTKIFRLLARPHTGR